MRKVQSAAGHSWAPKCKENSCHQMGQAEPTFILTRFMNALKADKRADPLSLLPNTLLNPELETYQTLNFT